MKSRPMLFSAPMVRAILDGRKTQTRRTVVHEHIAEADIFSAAPVDATGRWEFGVAGEGGVFAHGDYLRCPFGEPGDRLWVRETWGLHAHGDETDWFRGSVRGVPGDSLRAQYSLALRADWGPLQEGCLWRPAIFMPRWASRITLEIAEVRVQRLQEIAEEDARAEGCRGVRGAIGQMIPGPPLTAREDFERMWDSINGKARPMLDDEGKPVLDDNDRPIMVASRSWSSNPWVWAVSFRRLS